MQIETVDDVLAHYGIKGMKWGVRRSSKQLATASSSSSSKKEVSDDAAVFNALRSKARTSGISSLSNDEIRVLNARAQVLQSYSQNFPKQKTKRAKVVDFFVKDILLVTGKSLAKDVARTAATKKLVDKGLLPKKGDKTDSQRREEAKKVLKELGDDD